MWKFVQPVSLLWKCQTDQEKTIVAIFYFQVKFSPNANLYATCSRDGHIKIWDGVSSLCINTFKNAHDGDEVCSVQFTRNSKVCFSVVNYHVGEFTRSIYWTGIRCWMEYPVCMLSNQSADDGNEVCSGQFTRNSKVCLSSWENLSGVCNKVRHKPACSATEAS